MKRTRRNLFPTGMFSSRQVHVHRWLFCSLALLFLPLSAHAANLMGMTEREVQFMMRGHGKPTIKIFSNHPLFDGSGVESIHYYYGRPSIKGTESTGGDQVVFVRGTCVAHYHVYGGNLLHPKSYPFWSALLPDTVSPHDVTLTKTLLKTLKVTGVQATIRVGHYTWVMYLFAESHLADVLPPMYWRLAELGVVDSTAVETFISSAKQQQKERQDAGELADKSKRTGQSAQVQVATDNVSDEASKASSAKQQHLKWLAIQRDSDKYVMLRKKVLAASETICRKKGRVWDRVSDIEGHCYLSAGELEKTREKERRMLGEQESCEKQKDKVWYVISRIEGHCWSRETAKLFCEKQKGMMWLEGQCVFEVEEGDGCDGPDC